MNGANGMSDIEGKAALGSGERVGEERVSNMDDKACQNSATYKFESVSIRVHLWLV